MARHGKRYNDAKKKAPEGLVSLEEAVDFVKTTASAKFDETVEVAIQLGVDPKKSDQAVRGNVSLPNGTGKNIKVVVFAIGESADQAKEAGADEVGFEDLIERIKEGWTDFDVAIATTDAMKEVRKIARVLGPRGLMPNPKTGTVTDDTATAVKAAKGGKVDFRMDRYGSVCVLCGKCSFEADKLVENIRAILNAVRVERPASAKGTFLRSLTISSTMGVGVSVQLSE